jgi:hypothetical protein
VSVLRFLFSATCACSLFFVSICMWCLSFICLSRLRVCAVRLSFPSLGKLSKET